jgi:hypothetical protein
LLYIIRNNGTDLKALLSNGGFKGSIDELKNTFTAYEVEMESKEGKYSGYWKGRFGVDATDCLSARLNT